MNKTVLILIMFFGLFVAVNRGSAEDLHSTYIPMAMMSPEPEIISGTVVFTGTDEPLPEGYDIWFLEVFCQPQVGCAKILDLANFANGKVLNDQGQYSIDVTGQTAEYFLPVHNTEGGNEKCLPKCLQFSDTLIPRGDTLATIEFPKEMSSSAPPPWIGLTTQLLEEIWTAPITVRH